MQYRSEIDGLRSFAVLPVILFHAGISAFSGGFVGVDVFFVISGYLITSIIINDLAESKFSIINFYERRARRILPALFFVIMLCMPIAWLLMFPAQLKDFAQSIVAVILFSSNILFWMEDDYFGAAAEEKPLLHTWSLGVEEQYYFLFPLVLAFVWKHSPNRAFSIVLCLAIGSFALAEFGARYAPVANFYLLPSRAWELLVGSLCAIQSFKRPRGQSNSLSLVGLGMILASVFSYDEKIPFPSYHALVPTIGTALVILHGTSGTWTARFLSFPLFTKIGLISFSAYLWHQPIFAFARIYYDDRPSTAIFLGLAFISLLLAYFSWKYVERPFRSPQRFSRRAIFFATAGASIVLAAIGFAVARSDGLKDYYASHRIAGEGRHFMQYYNIEKTPYISSAYRLGTCFLSSGHTGWVNFSVRQCLKKSENKKNLLLIGDSYGAHLSHGLRENYPNYNIMQVTVSGCRPILPLEGEDRCVDVMKRVFEEFLPRSGIDVVVVGARWKSDDAPRLLTTVQQLGKFADRVVVFGPALEFRRELPLVLARNPDFASRKIDVSSIIEKNQVILDQRFKNELWPDHAVYISIIDVLCENAKCATVTSGGVPISWDYGHLTPEASVEVVARSAGLLRAARVH